MNTTPHLYKMTCWKNNSGVWSVNDIQNLAGRSAKWYTPMRILDLTIEEYIHLLVDMFHAQELYYYEPTNYLNFYFSKEKDAKAFCSYVNKIAKNKKYYCI